MALTENIEHKKELRHDWGRQEIADIYNRPLLSLIYEAATIHRMWHKADEIQLSTLLSIKTGGCPEDCSYCGQAARYHTDIQVQALLPLDTVRSEERRVGKDGSAWPV